MTSFEGIVYLAVIFFAKTKFPDGFVVVVVVTIIIIIIIIIIVSIFIIVFIVIIIITTKPRTVITMVSKNQIYLTYPLFIFETSFRRALPPFSSLHH